MTAAAQSYRLRPYQKILNTEKNWVKAQYLKYRKK